nr:DUF1187 family protein [Escherichia coli]
MYKITATIEKEGGTPTNWTRYSKTKLTKSECEKMLLCKKRSRRFQRAESKTDKF